MRVALVALGPSSLDYVQMVESAGDKKALFDEVWLINTYGSVLQGDIVFHMDDIRIQMRRAETNVKIANLVEWLRTYKGRVITSRAHPDFPCLEEFPLEEVLDGLRTPYFNGTVAYAVAYALWRGDVTELSLYGVDYNWRGASELEPGRACLEYWLGRATERGISLQIAQHSTLMDTNCRALYGYDTEKVEYALIGDKVKIRRTPKEEYPSGEEMEKRYDHTIERGTTHEQGQYIRERLPEADLPGSSDIKPGGQCSEQPQDCLVVCSTY